MKTFYVDVDVTLSTQFHIEAESQEQATEIAGKMVEENPNYYAARGSYVEHSVIDAFED